MKTCEYKDCQSTNIETEDINGRPLALCEDHGRQFANKYGYNFMYCDNWGLYDWVKTILKKESIDKFNPMSDLGYIERCLVGKIKFNSEGRPIAEYNDEGEVIVHTFEMNTIHCVFFCPWCDKLHMHGAPGDGARCSHCLAKSSPYHHITYHLIPTKERVPRIFRKIYNE